MSEKIKRKLFIDNFADYFVLCFVWQYVGFVWSYCVDKLVLGNTAQSIGSPVI